jgi:two-component system, cell cycle sensor histidine kinase and response regulator CckA
LTKVMDKKEASSYEIDKALSDGNVISVIVAAKPLLNESGGLIGIIETFIDITDRKFSEEKLRESEQRYRTVADFTYDWEHWLDLDGKLLYVSPSCERITGYWAQDFLDDPKLMSKIIHPDQSPNIVDHFHVEEKGDDHQSYNFDFRIVCRNGETRWINHVCQRVSSETGQPLGRRGSNRDITDRKNLERQLLHAQKMEAIGTLAGGIAHDFNNLLQVIQGYSELILLRKQPDDEDCADLQKVYESSKRGGDLVKSLLLFSRKVQPELRPMDLNHEIVEIQKLLFHTVPKTIKIELRLTGEPKTVLADPSQIGQVLMNLGVNARDAMPDGGTLAIGTANVELDSFYCSVYPYLKPGTYVLLTVSDSGHGMDKKTLSRIFEPFFTTKEVGKGTGLGLATVYAIVKQHSGYIQCYSEPGRGTTFKIYLPAVQATEEPEAFPEKAPIIGGTETILLVDDDNSIKDLGASTLNHFGYQVITAPNGKEALEIYQQQGDDIALIVLDLMMPEMDGRHCLAEILKINPKAKVLIASGYTEPWQGSGMQANMAKGFIKKPYDARSLLQMVRDTLDDHHLA